MLLLPLPLQAFANSFPQMIQQQLLLCRAQVSTFAFRFAPLLFGLLLVCLWLFVLFGFHASRFKSKQDVRGMLLLCSAFLPLPLWPFACLALGLIFLIQFDFGVAPQGSELHFRATFFKLKLQHFAADDSRWLCNINSSCATIAPREGSWRPPSLCFRPSTLWPSS